MAVAVMNFNYSAYRRNMRKAMNGTKKSFGTTATILDGDFIVTDHYGNIVGRLAKGDYEDFVK